MIPESRLVVCGAGVIASSFFAGGALVAVFLLWYGREDEKIPETPPRRESFRACRSFSPRIVRTSVCRMLSGRSKKEELRMMSKGRDTEVIKIEKEADGGEECVVDLLVHNVSHSDLVMSLENEQVLARPRFSKFAQVCEDLLEASSDEAVFVKLSRRELSQPAYPVLKERSERILGPEGDNTMSYNDTMPAGLRLDQKKVKAWSADRIFKDLKLQRRGETSKGSASMNQDKMLPSSVYLPLVAIVVRAWLKEVCAPGSRRVLLLVTGTGTPRDESGLENRRGNSTRAAAELAEAMLKRGFDERIDQIVKLHSESNIFRYDENISFVRHELEPTITKIRAAVVSEHGNTNWADRFRVAISSCDGAPARVATIQRSLRLYRPTGIHVWQPKTFWEHRILSTDDVEVLPFAAIETYPAQPSNILAQRSDLYRLIEKTRERAAHFQQVVMADHKKNDLAAFWHRKSRRIVLAVLLVKKYDADPGIFYSGTNMEVSMPTGSLCAERNAIGSALADDLGLMRHHLKLLAVLGLHLPPDRGGAATFIASASAAGGGSYESFKSAQSSPASSPKAQNPTTINEHYFPASSEDAILPPPLIKPSGSENDMRRHVLKSYPKINLNDTTTPSATSRVYQVHQQDFNPLKPCGSCAEWLKKIAAVNPDFAVVTFTDASCRGYYLESAALY